MSLPKRLSVYYFKGQDYWVNPRLFRDDMKRLRDAGADSINVCVHEADLLGGSVDIVCEAAKAAGLEVWGVPSRVGGLVAGWHRAPGHLAAHHPDLWARNADGSVLSCFGPQISIHHPDAVDAVYGVIERMLSRFELEGLVWDELKCLDITDHSESALRATGGPSHGATQIEATVQFFSSLNARIKAAHPALPIALFVFADMPDETVETCARVLHLDEFGCDGRCLRREDPQGGEGGAGKILLSGNYARFQKVAKAAGLRSFCLIETQLLSRSVLQCTLDRLDELFALAPDRLIYYDFPQGMEDPEWFMPLHAQRMCQWRGQDRQ